MVTDVFHRKPWILFPVVAGSLASILAFVFTLYPAERPSVASSVRIQNDTGTALWNVHVNGVSYGDLPVDGLTKYQDLAPAYRYADVELHMLDKKIHIRPDDYVGEQPLGKGMFTYKIQNRGSSEVLIDIQAIKDPD